MEFVKKDHFEDRGYKKAMHIQDRDKKIKIDDI